MPCALLRHCGPVRGPANISTRSKRTAAAAEVPAFSRRGWGGTAAGPSSAPTFVRVVQLEDVRVLRVIRQLHHPAHDGDLFARRGFVLENNAQPGAHTLPPLRGLSRPPAPCSSHGMKAWPGEALPGTYVFPVCAPQGLGSVVQEGGSREDDPVPGPGGQLHRKEVA